MIPVKDYIKMKISDASVPREGIMHVMLNRWWMTDGENILFYRSYSYPQCNHNKKIASQISEGQNRDVVFMPIVYVPHDCSDYL
jgi:hypothetical protein